MALLEWKTLPDGRVAVRQKAQGGPYVVPVLDGPDVGTKRTLGWMPLAKKYATKYGVPLPWVLAFIYAESMGDAKVKPSKANARGLMQILPETAAPYGATAAQLDEPETNIRVGVAYMRDQLHEVWKGQPQPPWDLPHVASLYNGGPSPQQPGGKRISENPWGLLEDIDPPPGGHIMKVVRASNYFIGHLATLKHSTSSSSSSSFFPALFAAALVGGVVYYGARSS